MKPTAFYRDYLLLRGLLWLARHHRRLAGDHARHGQQARCVACWAAHIATCMSIREIHARLLSHLHPTA